LLISFSFAFHRPSPPSLFSFSDFAAGKSSATEVFLLFIRFIAENPPASAKFLTVSFSFAGQFLPRQQYPLFRILLPAILPPRQYSFSLYVLLPTNHSPRQKFLLFHLLLPSNSLPLQQFYLFRIFLPAILPPRQYCFSLYVLLSPN